MAHKVSIRKIPEMKKDGTFRKQHYIYVLKCASRHGVHWRAQTTSMTEALMMKDRHHIDCQLAYVLKMGKPEKNWWKKAQVKKVLNAQ